MQKKINEVDFIVRIILIYAILTNLYRILSF